jgi:cytochrome c-type biogenesis protein CcmH/NrfG
MSRHTRALIVGTTLAAMHLAAMTTVAQAQTNDQPTSNQDARQPPTERQVGEAWRHRQVAVEQPAVADDTRRPPTEAQVGETWRHPTSAPVPPAEPSGQPSWLLPSLGVLAAVLVLAGGLAVLAAKRAGRRARVGHAA